MTEPDERLVERLRSCLDPIDLAPEPPLFGDGDLDGISRPTGRALRHAAVVAPLVLGGAGPRLVLTERAGHLNRHAGQIAFPGGRVDEADAGPAAAALRELEEELGIGAGHVELLGRFDSYETVTGFHVTPFVGILRPGYRIVPDANEVADVFEAPFDFLMDAANHQRHSRVFQGQVRQYYAMPWQGRYIWGATAGMLKSLHDRLNG
ncbi:NUDIX hydrolase [Maricaulis sp. CAU 1757]